MKYREKPKTIEAFQFYVDPMPDWFMDKVTSNEIILHNCNYQKYSIVDAYCKIDTKEDFMTCNGGDFVIKNERGEIYPCKPDYFLETYEKME